MSPQSYNPYHGHFPEFNIDRVEQALKPEIPKIGLIWLDETGSTNEEARRLAKWGALEWTVVVAGVQTGGRGRYKRTWASPPGGLYQSLLLRLPQSDSPVTLIPLLVGLALKQGIEDELSRLGGGDFHGWLKWPNDLVTERGKLAGILCEASVEKDRWEIIAGAGVNLEPVKLQDHSDQHLQPASSLLEEFPDLEWTREEVLTAYLHRLKQGLDLWARDPEQVRKDWLEASGMEGREVEATSSGEKIRGIAQGIGEGGELQIETEAGLRKLNAAEALIVRDHWL
ncbi:biotin--[acetyl-CoA-carboxylase] ligase [bacterium]|nr:biotin--[acetyl-CoA-carboxylase] ligase [bacterium]